MSKTVTQNIHAPVYGHVVGGDLTVVEHCLHQEEPERTLTWWDLSSDELQNYLRAERAEWWRAWRRYWFNPPGMLIVLFSLGLLTWLLSILSSGQFLRAGAVSPVWLIAVGFGFVIANAVWLNRIRRVELTVARHTRASIEAIELVLRRRGDL